MNDDVADMGRQVVAAAAAAGQPGYAGRQQGSGSTQQGHRFQIPVARGMGSDLVITTEK